MCLWFVAVLVLLVCNAFAVNRIVPLSIATKSSNSGGFTLITGTAETSKCRRCERRNLLLDFGPTLPSTMELLSRLESYIPKYETRAELTPFLSAFPIPLLVVLSLLAPRSRLCVLAVVVPFVFSLLYVSLAYTTGDPNQDFGIAQQNMGLVLTCLDRFFLSNPNDFCREGETRPPQDFIPRAAWAAKLAVTMRGCAWNWDVTPHLTRAVKDKTRGRFIRRHLGLIVGFYLAMDTLSAWMQLQPYFLRQAPYDSLSFGQRIAYGAAGGVAGALAISLLYSFVCVLAVGSGIWSMQECPNLFGSVGDATTVARFWGRTWYAVVRFSFPERCDQLERLSLIASRHQSLRRHFSRPGIVLCSHLKLSPSSALAKAIVVSTAFFLSGLLHFYGLFAMARRGTSAFAFFILQPLAIAIESIVIYFAGRVGIKSTPATKVAGFIWTLCWLLGVGGFFLDDLVQVSCLHLPALLLCSLLTEILWGWAGGNVGGRSNSF